MFCTTLKTCVHGIRLLPWECFIPDDNEKQGKLVEAALSANAMVVQWGSRRIITETKKLSKQKGKGVVVEEIEGMAELLLGRMHVLKYVSRHYVRRMCKRHHAICDAVDQYIDSHNPEAEVPFLSHLACAPFGRTREASALLSILRLPVSDEFIQTQEEVVERNRVSFNTEDPFVCRKCHTTSLERLRTCAACRKTFYCSTKCQRADWPEHKKEHAT